jgi:sugar transferase (PEP-CTERM/EpsH1 system associated)
MTEDAAKADLLFLCHRIPYPPDKGDKIRSYHWLCALAKRFRVHLAAFVDDKRDWIYRDVIESLCASSLLLPLRPASAKLRSLRGLLTGQPLSLPYYRDDRLTRWLTQLTRSCEIRHVFVYSSVMAQYAAGAGFAGMRRVIDFVDVDSDKWRQYAEHMRAPMSWVYGREARRLEGFELDVARGFDFSIFVSPAEARWFRDRLNGGSRVTYVNNGVDSTYFDPELVFPSPYSAGVKAVVFTGAMDYWANADAVSWFKAAIWPRVRSAEPKAVFYIVGAHPAPAVQALACEDVVVTGRVPDVRPYLRHGTAVIVPMRIARGIQNKVLEGMAMARPVVVTSKGLEGISAKDRQEVLVADEPAIFARRVIDILMSGADELGIAARAMVRRAYSWTVSDSRLADLVEGSENEGAV